MVDEDLAVLFMKIDANGSGGVDWDEFTGFLLQARTEERKKKTLLVTDGTAMRRAFIYWYISQEYF